MWVVKFKFQLLECDFTVGFAEMVEKCLSYKETGGFKIRTALADGYSMVHPEGKCFKRNCFHHGS